MMNSTQKDVLSALEAALPHLRKGLELSGRAEIDEGIGGRAYLTTNVQDAFWAASRVIDRLRNELQPVAREDEPKLKWPFRKEEPLHGHKIGDEVSISERYPSPATGWIRDLDASGSRNKAKIEFPDGYIEWVTLSRVFCLGKAPKTAVEG